VPLSRARSRAADAPLVVNHSASFPLRRSRSISRPALRSGDAVKAIAGERNRPAAACRPAFQGAALAFQLVARNTLLLILAAIVTMYIVLGVLYESYIHPLTILSTLPSAGVGALLALLSPAPIWRHRDHRHHPADRHREEERDHDDRLRARRRARRGKAPREAIYQACLLRFRPILMTTMAALARRAAADDRHRRRLGTAPSARHHDGRRLIVARC
jgi:multidrug efflux pump